MLSNKKKTVLWISIIGAALVIAAVAAFLIIGILLPYNSAKNTMDPNGLLTIQTRNDGTLQVEWPAGQNAQSYKLQVLEDDGTLLYSCSTTECFSPLPELPTDRKLTVRVTSSHDYANKTREGDQALETQLTLASPEIRELTWSANADQGTVDVSFDMADGDICRVYMATGEGAPVLTEELKEGAVQLKFGENEKYAVPSHEEPLTFTFQLEKRTGQVSYKGNTCEGFTLTREHMLSAVLNVERTDNGENSYTLTWNETKGDHYEVRLSEDGGQNWQTLVAIPKDQERSYTTRHLNAYKTYTLQVVAVGGQTKPDNQFAAESPLMEVKTGAKLLYSTIWPLMDQPVYGDAAATQELGTAKAGSAWCVLGLEGKYLKIRFEGKDGYINSDYCMINLSEYIGDLCLYNITNSYSSIYLVHEYGIDRVSGTVITGYENIKVGEDEYLVPLLFPTAQKLIKAGEAAREQGYTLKIYDSYRPKNATDNIYSLTNMILDDEVPAYTYSGKTVNDLHLLDWDPEEKPEEETPPEDTTPEEPTDPPSEETTESTTDDTTPSEASIEAQAEDDEPEVLTYGILMTNNGKYLLSAFLAPGNSRHNFGIALDLTLVDSNGRELSMQTSMHDLSWYSASKRNNTNAYTLYKIMTGAGFKDLYSEWWHFQDNEIYTTNKYEPLKTGVTWQCWVLDETGWRYRLADGSFYTGCTQTIDGQSYTFDENGYIVEEQ